MRKSTEVVSLLRKKQHKSLSPYELTQNHKTQRANVNLRSSMVKHEERFGSREQRGQQNKTYREKMLTTEEVTKTKSEMNNGVVTWNKNIKIKMSSG